jgi:hypothetical protein
MKYTKHKDNPKSFRSLTGLTVIQFSYLLPFFEAAHDDYLEQHEMNGKLRSNLRRFCIYKNSPLSTVSDRLFFILVYLKNNLLLRLTLHNMGLVPAQTDKELSKRLSELSKEGDEQPVLMHDGTEREIPRPVDYDRQKEQYSGKKKRHTVKNAVVITVSCMILFVSQTVCGKTHDKKMADTMYSFPVPCALYQDTGYQGYAPKGVMSSQGKFFCGTDFCDMCCFA